MLCSCPSRETEGVTALPRGSRKGRVFSRRTSSPSGKGHCDNMLPWWGTAGRRLNVEQPPGHRRPEKLGEEIQEDRTKRLKCLVADSKKIGG